MLHKWTGEVEALCEKLRINCVNLSEYHRRRYYHFKSYGKYFRLPMIVLASINSTASVGLQPVLEQQIISGITCFIGILMGFNTINLKQMALLVTLLQMVLPLTTTGFFT